MLQRLLCFLALAWLANPATAQMVQVEADFHSQYQTPQGETVREWYQNVKLQMEGRTLTCDTMRSFEDQDLLKFFGNPFLRDSGGMTLSADTIFYYKATKLFQARYNVLARDENSTLRTDRLDYHRPTEVMEYFGGGVLQDDTTRLESQYGRYGRNSQVAFFKNKVKVSGENYTLTTDSLRYNLATKDAFFRSRTRIDSEDGLVISDEGQYNTRTKKAKLYRRSSVETPKYFITADRLKFDRNQQDARAFGNVVLESKADTTFIYGDRATYFDDQGRAKVWGRALAKQKAQQDTLYLQADTLLALGTSETMEEEGRSQKQQMHAWPNARFIYQNLSGRCDSLDYQQDDSTLYFFGNPMMWTKESQMSGDTILALFSGQSLDRILLRTEAFTVSEDTLGHLNQVQGRNMTAYFLNDTLERVHVIGNGRSIYFALEGDTALVGMNRVVCSDMMLYLDSTGKKMKRINFIRQPDARFVPPHEIVEPDTRLPGFVWRPENKPRLSELLAVRKKNQINPQDSIPFLESRGLPPTLNPQRDSSYSDTLSPPPLKKASDTTRKASSPAPKDADTTTPATDSLPRDSAATDPKNPNTKPQQKPNDSAEQNNSWWRKLFPKKSEKKEEN